MGFICKMVKTGTFYLGKLISHNISNKRAKFVARKQIYSE